MIRLLVVCLGNICRSPVAEGALRHRLADARLAKRVEVDSCGTGDWHVGEPADHRARATLREHGHNGERHRAKQFRPGDFEDADLVLALDRSHLRTLTALARTDDDRAKVRLLRSFDPLAESAGTLDVADPYFGSRADFEETYRTVVRANLGLIAHLRGVLEVRR